MGYDAELERLAKAAVDCGFQLHSDLGPGLLESVYEILMFESLRQLGLNVRRQVHVPIQFRGIRIENGFKADLVVEGKLLIELKSTERHAEVHAKQVITYLRLMDLRLGLLMNFGMATFKEGVKRLGNAYFAPHK